MGKILMPGNLDGLVQMPRSGNASGPDGGADFPCFAYDYSSGLQIPGQDCSDPSQALWEPIDPFGWWKADAISGLTDGQVICGTSPSGIDWVDSGIGDHHLGGNSDASHPVYKTNILNGLPVVRWTLSPNNATDLVAQNSGATPGINSAVQNLINGLSQIHIFCVVLQRESSGLFIEAESNLIRLGTNGSGMYFVDVRRNSTLSVTTLTSSIQKVTNQYDIIHLKIDYASAIASMEINASTAIAGGSFQNAGVSAQAAATFIPTNSSAASNLDLPELIIDTTNLDQTITDKYVGYLAWKWGLQGQLPSGFPYKNSPPRA